MRAGGIFGGDSLGTDDLGPNAGSTTAPIPTELIVSQDAPDATDVGPTTPAIRTERAKTPVTATGVLVVLGLTIAGLYALWPRKVRSSLKTNPRRRRAKKRSESQLWDQLWENYIAARKSGNKQRILDTAELLEMFDKTRGWKPTVSVAAVKREHGW